MSSQLKKKKFSLAHTGGNCLIVKCVESVVSSFSDDQKLLSLIFIKKTDFFVFGVSRCGCIFWIAR